MEEILKLVGQVSDKIGVVALLVSFVWALDKEKVVTGSQYKQEQQRAERAEARAEKLETQLAEMTETFRLQVEINQRTARILEAQVRGRTNDEA